DRVLHEQFIDEVFISSRVDAESFGRIASLTYRKRIDCKVISEVHPGTNPRQATKFVGNFAVLELYAEPITSSGSLLKRVIDIFGAGAAVLVTSPVFLLIALAIRLESKGPVIYSAVRVGKKGKTFKCLKFRTMVPNADDLKQDLAHLNERDGALFKITNDPRITRVGRILRKISLDELPQFLNVLAGDMSMVGPRPPDLFDYNRYDYRHLRRLDVTPGITGLWQVTSRKDPSFNTMMQLDLEYIENWSLYMDFKIMFLTLPALARGA
ncbi:MAG: sugar transferase, partial [Acidobacteriaceae bacterium]